MARRTDSAASRRVNELGFPGAARHAISSQDGVRLLIRSGEVPGGIATIEDSQAIQVGNDRAVFDE